MKALPPAPQIIQIIRLKTVVQKTGLSKSSLNTLYSIGDFPRKIQLGARAVGYLESEVNAWILNKVAKRA